MDFSFLGLVIPPALGLVAAQAALFFNDWYSGKQICQGVVVTPEQAQGAILLSKLCTCIALFLRTMTILSTMVVLAAKVFA